MPHDLVPVVERFRAIADEVLSAQDLPVDPWLYRYCGSCGDPDGAARYVRYHADLLQLAGVVEDHPVVVDAGCGFGFPRNSASLRIPGNSWTRS